MGFEGIPRDFCKTGFQFREVFRRSSSPRFDRVAITTASSPALESQKTLTRTVELYYRDLHRGGMLLTKSSMESSTTVLKPTTSRVVYWKETCLKEDEDPENGCIIKKIRKRRMLVLAPHVTRNDIRRQYSQMILNAYNSHDLHLLQSFFATYCSKTCCMHRDSRSLTPLERALSMAQNSNIEPTYHYHRGLFNSSTQGILLAFSLLMQLAPDQVLTAENVQVATRSDSDATLISMDFCGTFTHIYDTDAEVMAEEMAEVACRINQNDNNDVIASCDSFVDPLRASLGDLVSVIRSNMSDNSSQTDSDTSGSSTANSLMSLRQRPKFESSLRPPDAFAFYYYTRGTNIPLIASPQLFSVRFRFTMHVNAQRQIDFMEWGNYI